MQLREIPTEAELEQAYGEAASDDYVEEEAGQRATARACSSGSSATWSKGRAASTSAAGSASCSPRRARAAGIPSTASSRARSPPAYARERLGLDVRTDDLLTADLPAGAHDAVVLGDVIEHLPDPGDALDRMHGPARARRRGDADAPRRRQPPRARDGRALVVGDPDPRPVLHAREPRRACSATTASSCATSARRRRRSPSATTSSGSAATRRRCRVRSSPARARVGVADRIWAPDFRDRMVAIAVRR